MTDYSRYRLLSRAAAITPKSGMHMVYTDTWWITDENGNLYFYEGHSPQCNAVQKIAEAIRDKVHKGKLVEQIPVVFVPVNVSDFSVRIPKDENAVEAEDGQIRSRADGLG